MTPPLLVDGSVILRHNPCQFTASPTLQDRKQASPYLLCHPGKCISAQAKSQNDLLPSQPQFKEADSPLHPLTLVGNDRAEKAAAWPSFCVTAAAAEAVRACGCQDSSDSVLRTSLKGFHHKVYLAFHPFFFFHISTIASSTIVPACFSLPILQAHWRSFPLLRSGALLSYIVRLDPNGNTET